MATVSRDHQCIALPSIAKVLKRITFQDENKNFASDAYEQWK
jgi:hypothetical protein